MGALPEERRPDGPEKVRRRMTKARKETIRIFRYRGIKTHFTRPAIPVRAATRFGVAAGAQGVGGLGFRRRPKRVGGPAVWIAPFPGDAGYYVIAEGGRPSLSRPAYRGLSSKPTVVPKSLLPSSH